MLQYDGFLSGSRRISRLICMPTFAKPETGKNERSSADKIYLGKTSILSIPFFLDFDSTFNPHVLIAGTSGSGKTFTIKSIMAKLGLICNSSIISLDFTGEYASVAKLISASSKIEDCIDGSVYINLKSLPDMKIAEEINSVLAELTSIMKSRRQPANRIFIIIDEAWKSISDSPFLSSIIREGRKYNICMILASQLVNDIKPQMIANISTTLAFRLQDKLGIQCLIKNYGLKDEAYTTFGSLQIGSCIAIQALKSGRCRSLLIDKVAGARVDGSAKLKIGENVVEIKLDDLERIIRMISKTDPSVFIQKIESDGSITTAELINQMLKLGAERRKILSELRKLKITDNELSDAFASSEALK
jgi:hypothetical protein